MKRTAGTDTTTEQNLPTVALPNAETNADLPSGSTGMELPPAGPLSAAEARTSGPGLGTKFFFMAAALLVVRSRRRGLR